MERASSFRHLLSSLLILPIHTEEGSSPSPNGVNALTDDWEVCSIDTNGAKRASEVLPLLTALVKEAFYVVSSKAQKRVAAPAGVELSKEIDTSALQAFLSSVELDLSRQSAPHTLCIFPHRVVHKDSAPMSAFQAHILSSQAATAARELNHETGSNNSLEITGKAPAAAIINKSDSLFYLRPNAPVPDLTPLSRMLLETFEDPFKKKERGKKSRKTKKTPTSAAEMQPAGAISSDEGNGNGGNGRMRGRKKAEIDSEGLDGIDLTTPLRPDEIIPVQRHRETKALSFDVNDGSMNALTTRERTKDGTTKRKSKKSTEKSVTKAEDLLGMEWKDAVPLNSVNGRQLPGDIPVVNSLTSRGTSQSKSSSSSRVWLPIATHAYLSVAYAAKAHSGTVITLYIQIRNNCSSASRVDCTALVGSLSPIHVCKDLASGQVEKASLKLNIARSEDGSTYTQFVDCSFKFAFEPQLGAEFSSLNASIPIHSCVSFTPNQLTPDAFYEAMNKPSKRWASTELSQVFSGDVASLKKLLGAFLGAHCVDHGPEKVLFSCKIPPKGNLYCVIKFVGGQMIHLEVNCLRASKQLSERSLEEVMAALAAFPW